MFLLTAMDVRCGFVSVSGSGSSNVVRNSHVMLLLLRLFEWLVVFVLLLSCASTMAMASAAALTSTAAADTLSWPFYDYATPLLHTQRFQQPFDDFDDFNALGNEKSLNGNGNVLAAEMSNGKFVALHDLADNDDEFPAANTERRQRLWQWLLTAQPKLEQQQQQQQHQQQIQHIRTNLPRKTEYFYLRKLQKEGSTMQKREEKDFWQQSTEIKADEGDTFATEHENLNDPNEMDENINDSDDKMEHHTHTKSEDKNPTYESESKKIQVDENENENEAKIHLKNSKRAKDMTRIFGGYRLGYKPSIKPTWKRNKVANSGKHTFLPSISAGAMTHLGNFFKDLSNNVQFSEKAQLPHEQSKLLEGNHPLRLLHEKVAGEHAANAANADFLHALRTYRPSQKIRSLVSMNPRGYHGAQFIDPNYMWVGLGK